MQNDLQKIIQKIVESADPERVYLLSASNNSKKVESSFTASPLQWDEVEHYGFLVILKSGNDRKGNIHLQDKIEQRCQHIIPTSILVLPFAMFNQSLTQGNVFMQHIAESGKLLYNARTLEVAAFDTSNNEAWKLKNLKQYAQFYENGNSFVASFELFMIRKEVWSRPSASFPVSLR